MDVTSLERAFRPSPNGKAAASRDGMVASSFPDATEAGVHVLEQGGNAIDAACAVGFALGVCDPQMSGIGGQTLGLIHVRNHTFALDGSSRVPSLAHVSRLRGDERGIGYRAATVPSTPATFAWLHRRYGRLPWPAVVDPAVRIAREGCRITARAHALQARELDHFMAVPSRSGARYFLKDGVRPYDDGDLFKQPDLASMLERLAHRGVEEFYQGEVAQQIDADMRANDGFLRADDLALIPWPIVRQPLRRSYRGVDVATMPPPGAGRTLLLVLLMLDHLPPDLLAGETHGRYHVLAEALRKAFLLRTQRPFDPNTYPQVENKRMLDRRFAGKLAASIGVAIDASLPVDAPSQLEETTHFCVMDAEGGVASITQSVEVAYGSKAAADGLGFLYNSYMLALDPTNPRHPYYLRPNAVPWSSAAPSIVFHEGEPWIALGSPGSEQIYSSVAQCLINVVDRGLSLADAVDRPRVHCSIGGTLAIEVPGFDASLMSFLEALGYRLERRTAAGIGCVQAVLKCRTQPGFQGVADWRRDGIAAGPRTAQAP